MLTVKYTPNTPIKIKASCGSVQTEYISKLVSKVSNVPKKNLNPQKGNFIYFLSEYSKYWGKKLLFPILIPTEFYCIYSIA